MRRILIAGFVVIASAVIVAYSNAPAAGEMIDTTIYTKKGERVFRLELAATPSVRAKGLMHRDALAPADGMLFLFPNASDHAFWMKNTNIPLDILFISQDRIIVDIKANVPPHSLLHQRPSQPVIAAIELDGGRSARESIARGDTVHYVLPEGTTVH